MSGENDNQNTFFEFAEECEEKANLGNIDSQFQMGMAYLNGEGVIQNFFLAYKWFLVAQAGGHPKAEKHALMAQKELVDKEIRWGRIQAGEMLKEIESRREKQAKKIKPKRKIGY